MRKSAKAFRDNLRASGAFYTPEALAQRMRVQLPEHVAEVYDPTCGDGGLLRIFGGDVRKYGVEIDGVEAEKAMFEIDLCLNPIDDFLDRLQSVINKHRASESSPDNQTTTEDCL